MTLSAQSHGYDAMSGSYDRSHLRWLRFAGGEAQCALEGAVTALLHPGMMVLDVACGTGVMARRLLRGAQGAIGMVLLDASAQMLKTCSDIPAQRVQGCMTRLPFDANRFDLLTCAWGLETQDDPQTALNEFVRVTRPGGHICLVFCADRPARSILGTALRHRISATGRGRFLDHTAIRAQGLRAGATTVRVLHCTGPAAAMILSV